MTNPYESPAAPEPLQRRSWRFVTLAAVCWAATAVVTLATVWQVISLPTGLVIGLPCLLMAIFFQLGNPTQIELGEMLRSRLQHNALTSEMLDAQEFDYQQVLYRFSQGNALIFEGAVFRLSPTGELPLRLTASASVPDRDEDSARRVAAFLEQVNEHLRERSVEFANLTENHELRIVFFLSYAAFEEEIGGVVDGKLMWFSPAGFS